MMGRYFIVCDKGGSLCFACVEDIAIYYKKDVDSLVDKFGQEKDDVLMYSTKEEAEKYMKNVKAFEFLRKI